MKIFLNTIIKFIFLALYLFEFQLNAQPLPGQINLKEQCPDSFLVSFKTTKGSFVMEAHRSWSPLGCDRLYLLAKNGYYNNNVIYRVATTFSFNGGYVVQFGLCNNETANHAWEKAAINDEPVIHEHQRGSVNFASGGHDTRSVELAISMKTNAPLDTVNYKGAIGFPVIAEVIEGMDVLDALNNQYGNSVFDQPDSLYKGREYFDRAFPGLDIIITATIN